MNYISKLRPIQKNDLNMLNKWKNDKEVFKYLGGGFQPISIDQQEKWMENLIDLTGNNRRFIIENSDKKPIGMIGLYSINWIHRNCEIGIYIGDHDSRGKGNATDAYMQLESYAKNYLNLRKIKLKVVSVNTSAIKFWTKLGFEEVGNLSEERFIDGVYLDVKIMEKFINKER